MFGWGSGSPDGCDQPFRPLRWILCVFTGHVVVYMHRSRRNSEDSGHMCAYCGKKL